jgi:DNA repair protein RecN (Recombination protein N)
MLHHLRVRNLGVLEDAAIAPGPGFTVITGETGAGKTMLLGALRLLAGEKPSSSMVGPFADEAVAEGLLDDGGQEIGVSRVVPRAGRSRAYIDGIVASANALEAKLGGLVELVGQHDRLSLRSPRAIQEMVDSALDDGGRAAREAYLDTWGRYRTALADQRRLGGDTMALERELDLLRYQSDEIRGAGLEPGDDVAMESMATRLRSIERIRVDIGLARDELDRVSAGSGEVVAALRRLAGIDPAFAAQAEMADELDAKATELRRSVRLAADELEEDPEALAELETRLNLLGDLKRKYGRTLQDVLDFGEGASRRAEELEALLAQAASIGEVVSGLEAELTRHGAMLSEARRMAARRVEETTRAHLSELGLPTARLEIGLVPTAPGPSGADQVSIAFASGDRMAPGPIHEVASGGELSRLMLALSLASRARGTSTTVFDEIDAGVGGATALILGRKLADLATATQVLCVTHLPQVAAHATTHYVVERDGDRAGVVIVEGEERLTELSRMLAGLPDSERGRQAAAELLEGAHSD